MSTVLLLCCRILDDISLIELVGLVCAGGGVYFVSVLLLSRLYKDYDVIGLLKDIKNGFS